MGFSTGRNQLTEGAIQIDVDDPLVLMGCSILIILRFLAVMWCQSMTELIR